ncbi:baculoviral IAP repeat-containing protein 3-like [Ruditapes philippinarum]|uniref:baculoviral IAP repeat-containing protein 3-like n=1 Tax=Ruditapes philippinarum TaxID=129788 RepID=UPI00295AEFE4|nr:baculoviral IAP repeat-containing protein 3-like [Ruditapes philippinarum]
MQDPVRCFFCGGGMKNWAYGDSPWIEHARWFPACAYLKQCKGEDFVNLCQMSSMTFPTLNNFQLRDLDSHRTTIVEDQEIVDLNSIAAKRVFKMGYSQTQIEDAIRHTRLVVGQSGVLKAQNLLEYLLDNCHLNSDVTSPHTSTAGDEQNNSRSTGEDVPSSSESNTSNNTNGNTAVEAEDIEERQSLKEENRLLKEQMMCKVCMDKDANTVFLPCGHLVACDDCAKVLRKCAVCRKIIQGTVRTYPA